MLRVDSVQDDITNFRLFLLDIEYILLVLLHGIIFDMIDRLIDYLKLGCTPIVASYLVDPALWY